MIFIEPISEYSDKELIILILDGDSEAFSEIVRRYKQMVLNIAYDILSDYHLSEDCAQETFLDAYTGLCTLRNPDSVGSWLWGIARRKALSILSRNRKWNDISDYADILFDLTYAPENIVITSELRNSILSAFKSLGDKNRIVAELYFLQGVRTPEIARRLKLPLGTITYRLSAARNKLKGELKTMHESTEKTLSPDFEKSVMEKIEKLNNYYKDHGSMDGIADAIIETESLVQKLPDGQNKRSAYANIHRHRYFNIEETDEQYKKAVETAEKAEDGECLFNLFDQKYWKMWDNASETDLMALIDEAIAKVEKLKYAEGTLWLLNNKYDKLHEKLHSKKTGANDIIAFLNNDAIPRMEKLGYKNGIGQLIFHRGDIKLHLDSINFSDAAKDFEEAAQLISPDFVQRNTNRSVYAQTRAYLRAIKLWRDKIEPSINIPPAHETYINGVRLQMKNGVLKDLSYWGHQYAGPATELWPIHNSPVNVFCGAALFFDTNSMFYDSSMKDGEKREDKNRNTITRIFADETVTVPAGTFENCLHIMQTHVSYGSWDHNIISDIWYAPGAGPVKMHIRSAPEDTNQRPFDEIHVLDEYEINGGEGYVPFAKGNRWNYIISELADFVFQRSEIKVEWTDGEYAHCSVVNMYGLKKDFHKLYEFDTNQCTDVVNLMRHWGVIEKPADVDCCIKRTDTAILLLRRIIRLNENYNRVNAILREIVFLERMNDYLKKDYRILPSEFKAGFISVKNDGITAVNDKEVCWFNLNRLPAKTEENRYMGNNPLWLQYLLGKIWDDKWIVGYDEEERKDNGEVQHLSVSDGGIVAVKAGIFENCLKLTLSLEKTIDNPNYYADDNAWHCGTKEFWCAPGVGIVKIECAWGNMLTSNTELVSCSLPAGGGGYFPIHIGNKWLYEEINLTSENYICSTTLEIASGADNKYLVCVSREACFCGTN